MSFNDSRIGSSSETAQTTSFFDSDCQKTVRPIAIAIGVIIFLGGIYLLLGAFQIIPSNWNVIDLWNLSEKWAIVLGMTCLFLGIILGCNPCNSIVDNHEQTNNPRPPTLPLPNPQLKPNTTSTVMTTQINTMCFHPIDDLDQPAEVSNSVVIPFEIVDTFCFLLKPRDALALACVSKSWNHYVNEGNQKKIKLLLNDYTSIQEPYGFGSDSKKKYSSFNNLFLCLEHALYTENKNYYFALYDIETVAMIEPWGIINAIFMKPNDGSVFFVDFKNTIELQSPNGLKLTHTRRWDDDFRIADFPLVIEFESENVEKQKIPWLSSKSIVFSKSSVTRTKIFHKNEVLQKIGELGKVIQERGFNLSPEIAAECRDFTIEHLKHDFNAPFYTLAYQRT